MQTRTFLCVCVTIICLYVILYESSIPTVSRVAESFNYRYLGFATKKPSIPRIIHQIWNNATVPSELAENVRGIIRNQPFPSWQYYFWTKESGIRFIKDKYPFLYERIIDKEGKSFCLSVYLFVCLCVVVRLIISLFVFSVAILFCTNFSVFFL